MSLKVWLRMVGSGIALAVAFGGGYTLAHGVRALSGQVLGAQTGFTFPATKVMRVVESASGSVIIPKNNLVSEGENKYVFLVGDNNQVYKQAVQAQVWRGQYAQITAGLVDQDLIILDRGVYAGQVINYELINPEAGVSGLLQ